MYLHLGDDVLIYESDIVGIFNMETSTTTGQTRQFLADAQKGNRIVDVNREALPASFVVCQNGRQGETVYTTPIAAATLKKRAADPFQL